MKAVALSLAVGVVAFLACVGVVRITADLITMSAKPCACCKCTDIGAPGKCGCEAKCGCK